MEKDVIHRLHCNIPLGVFVVVVGVMTTATKASVWIEQAKLTAADAAAGDRFGEFVSLDGDYAVVGANKDDDKGTDAGAAYVFRRDGSVWTQQAKLIANDGATGDGFGVASLSGDYVLVGAGPNDDNGTDSGSAYIFHREGSAWTQQAKLTASDASANDHFGSNVFLSGDYAAVTAGRDDHNRGSVYIFHREDTVWTEQAKLTPSDGSAADWFGNVSISGDYALIGASHHNYAGNNSGAAYIFRREGDVWTEQAKLTPNDGTAYDYFGLSVSLSGDYAVVGTSRNKDFGVNAGSTYVFRRDGLDWTQQAKFTISSDPAGHYIGGKASINRNPLTISGSQVLAGAGWHDDSGTDSGLVTIIGQSGETWGEQGTLFPSDGTVGDYFGASVSLSGDYALIGAYGSDGENGIDSGAAYFFVEGPTQVAGRHIFYDDSTFDNPSNNAIATDKQALLPGQTATFDNYTNYDLGINGIMVDIAGLADPDSLNIDTIGDYLAFHVGNDENPEAWDRKSG